MEFEIIYLFRCLNQWSCWFSIKNQTIITGDLPSNRDTKLCLETILPRVVRDASAAVEEVHVAATASRSGGLVLCRCLDGRGVCGRGISRGHLRLTLLPRSVLKECVHSEHGGRRKREELKPRSTKVIHFLLVSRIPQPASHAHKFINTP